MSERLPESLPTARRRARIRPAWRTARRSIAGTSSNDKSGRLPAAFAREGDRLETGRLYVAPPDRHMLLVAPGVVHLDAGPMVHNTRPAIDPLFMSAAATYGPRVVGVVLSGRGRDGAEGLRMIEQIGGMALAEDPARAAEGAMPAAAVASDDPEILPIDRLAKRVVQFCSGMSVA
jgi:two-component system, chemotaxis family, protein-glutamate methylesterase/glutaminase